MQAWPAEENVQWNRLTKSDRTLPSFLIPFSNSLHKSGEVWPWWTSFSKMEQSANWTTSRSWIFWLEETGRNFRNLCIDIMENISSLHVLMHCSMAGEVMIENFLSVLSSINQACLWITRFWYCGCEWGKWSVVTLWHFISWQLGSGDSWTLWSKTQLMVEWFYRENIENRLHCNTGGGGEIKQDLVQLTSELWVCFCLSSLIWGELWFFSVK